jgi:L-aminopeptidase/D-esterase-like protein
MAATRPTLTRVRGVQVGVATDPDHPSGTTVVLFDRPSYAAVSVRGPASGTYDIASLALDATFGRRDALFLSGGSVYGLDAARGVRTRLVESGRGEPFGPRGTPVPRVSGAVLFDLPRQLGPLPEYLSLGYEATRIASRRPVPSGRVGAGAGAHVAKYRGPQFMVPGGQGSASARRGRHQVGLLAVFNSVGAIRGSGRRPWLAAARTRRGRILPPGVGGAPLAGGPGTNLAIVVTDAAVERATLQRIAERVHDGIARTVIPAHTSFEGDTVFAVSTAPGRAPRREPRESGEIADEIGAVAESLVADAAWAAFPE